MCNAPWPNIGFKKKLYQFYARGEKQIETHFSKKRVGTVRFTTVSLERETRQKLSDKISGTYVGLWLLLPEHLRLGTWDLLTAWSGIHDANSIEPRLALQLIHESALCLNGVRQRRSLRQKGFETLNGLPFVATDSAMHNLLDQHTVEEALSLQLALAKMCQLGGHYPGEMVILDPHRITTWSKRKMPLRKDKSDEPAKKTLQTFFAIDTDSGQPYFTGIGSSAVTARQGTVPLFEQLSAILPNEALILMDKEHFTADILTSMVNYPKFSFLMPAIRYRNIMKQIGQMTFRRHCAGYASAEGKYQIPNRQTFVRLLMQRIGETDNSYEYRPFLTNSTLPAETLMAIKYPGRWTIEELFNFGPLGWKRAATLNLNIHIAKLSLSLIAQTVIYQFRRKLCTEMVTWNHQSLAQKIFTGIDGDIRVKNDTILVTLYNAPNVEFFKEHYENLPLKLEREAIDPKIPWLYDFKLDFRFK